MLSRAVGSRPADRAAAARGIIARDDLLPGILNERGVLAVAVSLPALAGELMHARWATVPHVAIAIE